MNTEECKEFVSSNRSTNLFVAGICQTTDCFTYLPSLIDFVSHAYLTIHFIYTNWSGFLLNYNVEILGMNLSKAQSFICLNLIVSSE